MASKKAAQTSEKSNTVAVSEYLDKPEITDKIRRQVWKRLGTKSIRDIAADTGLKPEQVIEVKQQLLDEVDVLTHEEQIMKLMVTMHELVETIKEKAENVVDERNAAGLGNAAVNAVEKTLKQVRMLKREDNSKVTELNSLRVRELLRLMDRVVVSGVGELAEVHGLEEQDMLEVFQRHLMSEAMALDAPKDD